MNERRRPIAACAAKSAGGPQLIDHGVDLAFAAEEEMLLALVERTGSREGVHEAGGGGYTRRAHDFAFRVAAFTKSSNAASENPRLASSLHTGFIGAQYRNPSNDGHTTFPRQFNPYAGDNHSP